MFRRTAGPTGGILRLKYNPYDSFSRRDKGGVAMTTSGRQREDKISAARRRQEEQIVLPKTLKSGRFEEKITLAQKIAAEDERREDLKGKLDTRYAQRISDFRQISDPDPMSPLFGESKNTQKVRLKEWQRQFEKENEDTWLPYERTNWFTRNCLPNWFVKYLVYIRDEGGFGAKLAPGMVVTFLTLIIYYLYKMYASERTSISVEAIR